MPPSGQLHNGRRGQRFIDLNQKTTARGRIACEQVTPSGRCRSQRQLCHRATASHVAAGRLHKDRYPQDESLHYLVATAMRENWTSVRSHSERIEFRRRTGHRAWASPWGVSQRRLDDGCPLLARRCGFLYEPLLISASADYARPISGQMLEFCVRDFARFEAFALLVLTGGERGLSSFG
jgi:hypothetical protein